MEQKIIHSKYTYPERNHTLSPKRQEGAAKIKCSHKEHIKIALHILKIFILFYISCVIFCIKSKKCSMRTAVIIAILLFHMVTKPKPLTE